MQTNSDKENKRLIQPIWTKVGGNKTDRFDAVVLHFSEKDRKNIKIAINEWKFIDNESDNTWCVCSQKNIHDVYFIQNKHNGNILRTGCDCIEKVTKDNPESKLGIDVGDIAKQAEYRKRHKNITPQHRMCPSCKWYRIRVRDIDRTHCECCIENGDINMRSMVLIQGKICIVCIRPAIEKGNKTNICERCTRIEKEVVDLGIMKKKNKKSLEEYVEQHKKEDRNIIQDMLVMGTKAISLKHIEDVGELSTKLASLLKEED